MADTGAALCKKDNDHVLRGTMYFPQSKPLDLDGKPLPWAVKEPCDRCEEELWTYKYATAKECARRGGHLIRVATWPPPPNLKNKEEEPGLSSQCIECGIWCVVSERAHDGIKIDVITKDKQKQPA